MWPTIVSVCSAHFQSPSVAHPSGRIGAVEVHLLALHRAGLVNLVGNDRGVLDREDHLDVGELELLEVPVALLGHALVIRRIAAHRAHSGR
jgi:hypothetical protein